MYRWYCIPKRMKRNLSMATNNTDRTETSVEETIIPGEERRWVYCYRGGGKKVLLSTYNFNWFSFVNMCGEAAEKRFWTKRVKWNCTGVCLRLLCICNEATGGSVDNVTYCSKWFNYFCKCYRNKNEKEIIEFKKAFMCIWVQKARRIRNSASGLFNNDVILFFTIVGSSWMR